jgi:peptide-methionine (S)-S-oxide reductase
VLLDTFDGASFLLPPEVWRHFDWSIKHCVLRGDNSPIPLPKKSDL